MFKVLNLIPITRSVQLPATGCPRQVLCDRPGGEGPAQSQQTGNAARAVIAWQMLKCPGASVVFTVEMARCAAYFLIGGNPRIRARVKQFGAGEDPIAERFSGDRCCGDSSRFALAFKIHHRNIP